MVDPAPLEPGCQLADRFRVREVLGRGGFGIAYLADDLIRQDLAVIKELAPSGVRRTRDRVIQFDGSSGPQLRERFLDEAGVLSHLNVKGVPAIRQTFRENGTAYFAMDYVPGATTLEEYLQRMGRLSSEKAVAIFEALLDILEPIHAKRILHRDLKPSNILLDEDGRVYLIDFGAAREWHADSATKHTVFYTPGYAPPEQLSERARRGPATDLYALCATAFVMLAGEPPPSPNDRLGGIPLPALSTYRPDVDPVLIRTIEEGLSLSYSDRPQTVAELRDRLENVAFGAHHTGLEALDETLLRLKQFKYEKRSCPACGGLLHEAKPIKRNVCPVCHEGMLRKRDINEKVCPMCRSGVLAHISNSSPLAICPSCKHGTLHYRRKGILSLEQTASCDACDARYDVGGGKMTDLLQNDSEPQDFAVWRRLSCRSTDIWRCGDCPAQFDVLPDGRWSQVIPGLDSKYRNLFPDEWARVAIGLDPGSGNASCETCGADFYLEGGNLTLLDARDDPNGYAAAFMGRLISLEAVRWLAVGKSSPHAGCLCEHCRTEFDRDGDYLRLIATADKRMTIHVDRLKRLEDWHRIAQGLPTVDMEANFQGELDAALHDSYRRRVFSFDNEGRILWKGAAAVAGNEHTSTLTVTAEEIVFGGVIRKKRYPLKALVAVWADNQEIHLRLSGARDTVAYQVAPITLTTKLASGNYTIHLDARDLAARLSYEFDL